MLPYEGTRILPSCLPGDPFGAQILGEHFRRERADLIITLCDLWALEPSALRGLPVAAWMPVDAEPLSLRDEACLRESGAVPIAMSRFGERQLREAGFDPFYVPHGISLEEFKPSLRRDEARRQLGVPEGHFAVGLNAANKDCFRKGMAEQFAAFARFHARHPDTVLLVHSQIREKDVLDLETLRQRVKPALPEGPVRYVDQYALVTGQIPVEHMANWYSACDLYGACSLAEGFCIPLVEALACGVPVVATDAWTAPELVGDAGWLVPGEPWWNPTYGSWWCKPLIGAIDEVYETAYQRGLAYHGRQFRARMRAEPYGIERVREEHWKPVLAALEERFRPSVTLTDRSEGGPAISVCFASRGRPESCKRAVESLLSLAAEPDAIEVVVALDPDEDATAYGEALPEAVWLWTAPERFGYTRLHGYLNALVKEAKGEWVMWWNDDMTMVTHGWDKVIRASRPAVLWPHANHVGHANIAPIWPRAWSDAMGHASPTTHMDTYLQRLGEALGRHDHIPVEIVHDRADVTGGHDDRTYAEGRALLGPEGMVDEPFPYDQVAVDAAKIRVLLNG